jgi:hypothetical protein
LSQALLVCAGGFGVVEQPGGGDHEHDAVSADRGCTFVGEVMFEPSVDRLGSRSRSVELVEPAGVVGVRVVADDGVMDGDGP